MKRNNSRAAERLSIDINAISGLIADTQLPGGEIPWSPNDKTDPWDHVEAAMGLVTGGFLPEARRAFEWFLGRNDLNLPIYDPTSGGCRDGLHSDRVNENQGAESTLAFLQALLELRLAENPLLSLES